MDRTIVEAAWPDVELAGVRRPHCLGCASKRPIIENGMSTSSDHFTAANQERLRLSYSGDYSLVRSVNLAAAAFFINDMRIPQDADEASTLDLAFPVEGPWSSVGVRVTQRGAELQAAICANSSGIPAHLVQAQLERMLCIDVDGSGFAAVADRDKVLGEQVKRSVGIRPVLFSSPYEAAARAIIGQRLFVKQAAAVTASIAADYGVSVRVGDRVLHAFPAPNTLAEISGVRGLADRKIAQLRALGVAASAGTLDGTTLRRLTHEEASETLQRLPGIGPFSAELILLRGVGDPDAFPLQEKRLHRAMASLYELGETPDFRRLEAIADGWRPYRSWAGLILRNAVPR